MTTTTFIAVAFAVLGLILLLLFLLGPFQRNKGRLLAGALLMFAISIGIFLFGQPAMTSSEPAATNTPIVTQAPDESPTPPISPLSPISPVVTPPSTIIEIKSMDTEFEGCLLFASDRDGDFEIYQLRQNVNNLPQLTNSAGQDIEPAWSTDGKKIAFASNREEGAGFQIYVMNADGTDQERVGDIQPGDNNHPSWSPDGRQIVFQSNRDTNADPSDDNFDIYKMDLDGRNVTILTTHMANDSEPRWSPDGRKIAFLHERSGQAEVYIMDPDGTNVEQLTELPGQKRGINWSSDGRHIIFEVSGSIYKIDVEEVELTKLISDDNVTYATPTWAQGDEFVILSSDHGGGWDLYILDLRDPYRLVLRPLTDEPGTDRSPDWFSCSQ